ncbi:MAG: helix-turn-helix transcriptional regulator [Oscillospiraceae bacterium]|nr:helix-turn-helix transcriptional regulator [Oscillospiraceae bacterium]
MNTNRDLNYLLYVQKLNGFTRTAFNSELEDYIFIQSGDVERVKANFAVTRKDFLSGKAQLSDDPVRNVMYHLVGCAAMACRICVEGGMPHDVAYALSDIYIRRADKCTCCEDIIDLFEMMQIDFAQRMLEIRKNNAISIHIRRCINYIYQNLHGDLTVNTLAKLHNLNPSYLSKLFLKETGMPIKDFINDVKVTTAENMLKYTDFSLLDISITLGFSSQSAFGSVFKAHTGITPKKYRDKFYMNEISSNLHL